MARPPLLVIDPDTSRRAALSRELAAAGYEVVPVVSAEEGLRFAGILDSAVIVAAAQLPEVADGSLFTAVEGGQGSVVLLGERPAAVDDEVVVLPAEMDLESLCRKLHLILTGRQIGVEPDSRCEALVGDLSFMPLLEVVPNLAEAGFTGRLELERGTIRLAGGEVVSATAAPVRGRKAFCRLGRLGAGPFRIVPDTADVEKEIDDDLHRPPGGIEGGDLQSLIVAAIEDSMGEFPDPRVQVRVEIGPDFFSQKFSAAQQQIVQAAQQGASLQAVLDAGDAPDGVVVEELLSLADRGVAVIEEPEPQVLVVTDSTADLPVHLAREHGIRIVPLKVHFGSRVFRDGVDLEPRRFYKLLETRKAHPSTEPPAREEFLDVYREPFAHGDIVSVHISTKLSETSKHAAEAAKMAQATCERRPAALEVIDSRAVSVALGYQALFAARMAARGESAASIRELLGKIAPRIHVLFVVNTLDYLVRGGRVGKARGFIGNLLGIRPILGVRDGEVVPVDQVRGGKAAQKRLIEIMAERVEPGRPIVASVAHAKAPVWADRLARLARDRFQPSELMMAEIGPVVGTHVGPGTVGMMGFQPTVEEAELVAPLAQPALAARGA